MVAELKNRLFYLLCFLSVARPPEWDSQEGNQLQDVITVPRGSTVKLRCPATGDPRPTITWLRAGQDITGSDRDGRHKV